MKISTEGQSRFLAQEDVPAPFVATMDRVTEDRTLRNSDVLHFTDDQLKPFPLNLTNRRAIVAAYGNQSENWHGKPIELYVNPDVTDSKGIVTGGIRIRIPTGPAPVRAGRGPRAGAHNGTAPAREPKTAPTLEQRHAQLLDGYDQARTDDNLNEWDRWGASFPFTERQQGEADDHYRAALKRIALTTAPARRPAAARA
jgi:hypothetical protein